MISQTAIDSLEEMEVKGLLRDQLYAAIKYVKFGSDPTAGENPAQKRDARGVAC